MPSDLNRLHHFLGLYQKRCEGLLHRENPAFHKTPSSEIQSFLLGGPGPRGRHEYQAEPKSKQTNFVFGGNYRLGVGNYLRFDLPCRQK